jgi:hypothetical protein
LFSFWGQQHRHGVKSEEVEEIASARLGTENYILFKYSLF